MPDETGKDNTDEHTRHTLSAVLLQVQSYRTPPIRTNHTLMERGTTALSGDGKAESGFHKEKQRVQSLCNHQQQIL